MKLFTKLIIAALFIGVLLPFTILKDEDGNTMMSFSDIGLPDFSLDGLPDFSFGNTSKLPELSSPTSQVSLQSADEIQAADENLDGKDLFYKWYDADGNIQFTTQPPAEGVEFIVKGYDPDANVIPAVDVPSKEPASDKATAPEKITNTPKQVDNPYSQESIKKLFEDAKNIENMLNQRLPEQESVTNQ